MRQQASNERDIASQANVAKGGLPLNAIDRLREQASKQGTPKHFFTSDLSVNELLLTHQCGFEPLGQVMGSSIYHVGWYAGPGWQWGSGELTVITEAYREARVLAMSRLQQEAQLLGADGVVGVRLTQVAYDWGSGMIEFMAIGTAVRETGAPPLANQLPFVSGLSGQDHYALRRIGFKPVGFVVGNCTWFQYASWQTQNAMGGIFGAFVNQELWDFTQAVYASRELAMDRMELESRRLNASGIVGVVVDSSYDFYEQNNQRGLILHFTAWGTCVVADGAQAEIDISAVVPAG